MKWRLRACSVCGGDLHTNTQDGGWVCFLCGRTYEQAPPDLAVLAEVAKRGGAPAESLTEKDMHADAAARHRDKEHLKRMQAVWDAQQEQPTKPMPEVCNAGHDMTEYGVWRPRGFWACSLCVRQRNKKNSLGRVRSTTFGMAPLSVRQGASESEG